MKKIRKLRVLSFARFQAVLAGLIGLLCGVIYSFGGLLIDFLVSMGVLSSTSFETPGLSTGSVLAFGALIGMPVIFLIAGFFLGILEALLYNLITRLFKGFRLEIG